MTYIQPQVASPNVNI